MCLFAVLFTFTATTAIATHRNVRKRKEKEIETGIIDVKQIDKAFSTFLRRFSAVCCAPARDPPVRNTFDYAIGVFLCGASHRRDRKREKMGEKREFTPANGVAKQREKGALPAFFRAIINSLDETRGRASGHEISQTCHSRNYNASGIRE